MELLTCLKIVARILFKRTCICFFLSHLYKISYMVWRKRGNNMGKMNTITKDYMSEPKYFADSFNYYLFDGKQVIQSDNLQVLDPTEMALIPKETTIENLEKIREV